jgi:hypothetical protein
MKVLAVGLLVRVVVLLLLLVRLVFRLLIRRPLRWAGVLILVGQHRCIIFLRVSM